MARPELTQAQREVLRTLPQRVPIERIGRLWIFAPHLGKDRESGLFVVSTEAEQAGAQGLQALLTLRYRAEPRNGRVEVEEQMNEEGWAPRDRIDRVISGVLQRSGEDAEEPLEVEIDGREEEWRALLERFGIEVDPASR